MKKILFLFAFMAIAAVSFSQIRYGVKAGLNLANQKVSASGINITGDNIVGVNIGGIVEIPIASSFFFQPGISYSWWIQEINATIPLLINNCKCT